MITAELSIDKKSVGELISQIDSSNEHYVDPDVYDKLLPFRIFRLKDHQSESVPIYGNEDWINSTEIFPKRFEIVRKLYESEFIKVKLCKNTETNEQVRMRMFKRSVIFIRSVMFLILMFS